MTKTKPYYWFNKLNVPNRVKDLEDHRDSLLAIIDGMKAAQEKILKEHRLESRLHADLYVRYDQLLKDYDDLRAKIILFVLLGVGAFALIGIGWMIKHLRFVIV